MRIFKYHISLYNIYKQFNTSCFVAQELDKLELKSTMQSTLRYKGFVKSVRREVAERTRPEIKNWHSANWHFQMLTSKGLEICKYLDENFHLITKKILYDGMKDRI